MLLVESLDLVQVGSDWRWVRTGQIDRWLKVEVIVRYNDVGSWSLTLPMAGPQADLLGPG